MRLENLRNDIRKLIDNIRLWHVAAAMVEIALLSFWLGGALVSLGNGAVWGVIGFFAVTGLIGCLAGTAVYLWGNASEMESTSIDAYNAEIEAHNAAIDAHNGLVDETAVQL